jgi:dephospho-CoA kinase
MFLVGLTGGIASGKSTVAHRLVARHGARLIDADVVARDVVLPGTPTWHRIVEHFGEEVVGPDGFLDRPALGAIVFADPRQRAILNEFTHPPILREIADQLEELEHRDCLVVVDIALLVEMGADLGFDAVVLVAASPDLQERRLVELRAMERVEARQRIGAQAPLADKLAVATHVVHNEGTLDELHKATDDVAADLKRRAREKHRR